MLKPQSTTMYSHRYTWQLFGFVSVSRRISELNSAHRNGGTALPSILSIRSGCAIPTPYQSWRSLSVDDSMFLLSVFDLKCLSAALRYAKRGSFQVTDVFSLLPRSSSCGVACQSSVLVRLSDGRIVSVSDELDGSDLGYIVQSGHLHNWFDVAGPELFDLSRNDLRHDWAWASTLSEARALIDGVFSPAGSCQSSAFECH